MWYQIQTKLRDEPRPKAGLMRTREFTMKDSYSFDLDAAGLDVSFDAHRDAYTAPSSGSASPPSRSRPPAARWAARARPSSSARRRPARTTSSTARSAGTRPTARSRTSRLAARQTRLPTRRWRSRRPSVSTRPGVRTIEDLATGYDAPADRQIKTLVYVLDGALTLVLVRGDHALEEQKLIDATGATRSPPGRSRRRSSRALGAAPGLARRGRRGRSAGHRRRGPARPVAAW